MQKSGGVKALKKQERLCRGKETTKVKHLCIDSHQVYKRGSPGRGTKSEQLRTRSGSTM